MNSIAKTATEALWYLQMQKHETNGKNLLEGRVLPSSISTSTGNHFTTTRPVVSFPMIGLREAEI